MQSTSANASRPATLAVRALRTMLPAVVLVLAVGFTACGSNGDRSPGAPVDEPPWGLDTIDLPDDAASIETVLEAMPERVAGLARLEVRANEVHYEGDTAIRVINLRDTDLQAASVLEYARGLSESGEVEVEQEELDEDARLVYVVCNSTGDGRRAYCVLWGAPDSEWVFAAKADSPEARKALVQAFVEASSRA